MNKHITSTIFILTTFILVVLFIMSVTGYLGDWFNPNSLASWAFSGSIIITPFTAAAALIAFYFESKYILGKKIGLVNVIWIAVILLILAFFIFLLK